MAEPMKCPDPETVHRLLRGDSEEKEVETFAVHLERCEQCSETVEAVLSADTVANSLKGRSAVATDEKTAPSALIERLLRMSSESPGTPVAADPFGATQEGGVLASPDSVPLNFLSPPQQADELGRLSGYRVLRLLGAGGMGMVFEAEDVKLKRRVALKVMKPEVAAKDQHRLRFLREAQTAAAVEHDHVCPIYQVGEENGVPFIAMAFLKGEPLDVVLRRTRPMPLGEAIRIGREIAEGLTAAHEGGLVHRDIKPGNIWLESRGDRPSRARILDFGLARARHDDAHITASGAILGTPAFMAPEQARGWVVDHRADLFSLGIILYEMTTGRRPFTGPDTMAILTSLALDTPESPDRVNPAVPAGLARLIMQLLAKSPDQRPASARDVAGVLAELAVPNVVTDHPPARLPVPEPVSAPAPTPVSKAAPAPAPEPAPGAILAARFDEGATVSMGSPIRPKATAEPAAGSRKRRALTALVISVVFVGLGVLFGGTVIRIANNEGELVVTVEDPGTEVVVKDGGAEIRRSENGKVRVFVVRAGKDGEVEVREPGSDIVVMTEKFRVTRGGKTELTITAERLALTRPSPAVSTDREGRTPKEHPTVGDWIPIYNGRDLSGWETYDGKTTGWRVVDGHMVGQLSNRTLYFTQDFDDVHLRLEFKASAGSMLHLIGRAALTDYLSGRSYRLNLGFEGESVVTGSIDRWMAGSNAAHKPDEWVTVDWILRGSVFETRVNGTKVGEVRNDWFCSGYFGLRVASDGGYVAIRKIEARRLAPTTPPRDQSIGQWVTLTDGTDFGQFRTYDGTTNGWKIEDGAIVSPGRSPFLYSRIKNYRDFTLTADVQVSEGTRGYIGVRTPYQPEPEYYAVLVCADGKQGPDRTGSLVGIAPNRITHHRPDEWAKLEVTFRGDEVNIRVNDRETVRRFRDRRFNVGNIALGHPHPGTFKVRNVRIQEHAAVSEPIPIVGKPKADAVSNLDEAAAKSFQANWATQSNRRLVETNSLDMKFMLIPPGKFPMGSLKSNDARLKYPGKARTEEPQHQVEITRPFYMASAPVTVGQFRVFANDSGYQTTAEKAGGANWRKPIIYQADDHPVVAVTYDDAMEFCRWLSRKEGRTYVLPTEAQREYACRAGSASHFSFGDRFEELDQFAWFNDNSGSSTHPVARKKANAWGLHDMHGNVFEWCADWFDAGYYTSSPSQDPPGPKSGVVRAIRGGSYRSPPEHCRSATRGGNGPLERRDHTGFRIVLLPAGVDTDRRAAEYVLSVGGAVETNGLSRPVSRIDGLPKEPYEVTAVRLNGPVQLSESGVKLIADCKKLSVLQFTAAKFDDAWLAPFRQARELTTADFTLTAIGDAGLGHLRDCTKLTSVTLSQTKIVDDSLDRLANCKKLSLLVVDSTGIGDKGLARLAYWPELTQLHLGNTKVTDVGLSHLRACTKLERVHLESTKVSDVGIATLSSLNQLRTLILRKTDVTEVGVKKLSVALPNCRIEWDGGSVGPNDSDVRPK